MSVFYVLLLVPMLIQQITLKDYIAYEKRNAFAFDFFFVLLTILVMFRHESVGNDTRNYMYLFEKFENMNWNEIGAVSIEIGFSYFNKLVSLFTENPQNFIIISGIFVSAMIYPLYKRLCVDSALTIVLFCFMSTFLMMFSGIRQMIAVGIGLIAYDFVRNKRFLPYFLLICIAISFHTSAFMLLLMYPVYHAKITKKGIYILVPILFFIFMFNKPIFSILSLVVERYTEYEASITSTGAYTMLILLVLFAIFSFVIPEEGSLDNETIGLRNFLLLALSLQMFAPLHALAMRMNYYYIIFIPLLLPKIVTYRSDRWRQVARAARHVMVVFFLVYFFVKASDVNGNLHVFPYHFFWETI